MNEETIRKGFEEWATDHGYACLFSESRKMFMPYDTQAAWYGWLESARRADRKAREECCEIMRARKIAVECAAEYEQAYNHAIDDNVQAIRATIKEE